MRIGLSKKQRRKNNRSLNRVIHKTKSHRFFYQPNKRYIMIGTGVPNPNIQRCVHQRLTAI